jgi:hypothetical protein
MSVFPLLEKFHYNLGTYVLSWLLGSSASAAVVCMLDKPFG